VVVVVEDVAVLDVAVVVDAVLVVVGEVVVVGALVLVVLEVVVVVTQWQSSPHSGPKRRPGSGEHCAGLRLHGGSHSSPGSRTPFPQTAAPIVVDVVVDMVVVVEVGRIVVEVGDVVVVDDSSVVEVLEDPVTVLVVVVVVDVVTTLAATTRAGSHVAPGGQSAAVRQLPGNSSSMSFAAQRPAVLTKTSLPTSSASGSPADPDVGSTAPITVIMPVHRSKLCRISSVALPSPFRSRPPWSASKVKNFTLLPNTR